MSESQMVIEAKKGFWFSYTRKFRRKPKDSQDRYDYDEFELSLGGNTETWNAAQLRLKEAKETIENLLQNSKPNFEVKRPTVEEDVL